MQILRKLLLYTQFAPNLMKIVTLNANTKEIVTHNLGPNLIKIITLNVNIKEIVTLQTVSDLI